MAEESKNDGGQDPQENKAEGEAKSETKEGQGDDKKPEQPDPKQVISDLQKSENVREDQRHNLNAGLEKMTHTIGELRREIADIKEQRQQPATNQREEDPFAGLADGEDIVDATAMKKGFRLMDDRFGKRIDQMAEHLQQTVDKLNQRPAAVSQLTNQQQVDLVKAEFGVEDDYASYIITEAGPKIAMLDRENPGMTTAARDILVRSVLQKELDVVKKAVAQRQENKDSKTGKTTDPNGSAVSTKVTQVGASSATFADTTSDPPLNQADAKESMIKTLEKLRATGG